jgi:hypothetical protein
MTALATTNVNGAAPARAPLIPQAVERALIDGDLSGLSDKERMDYYIMRCQAADLDPRSQPFQYITLPGRKGRDGRADEPGKLTLYASKGTADQLIAKHRLSVKILRRGFDKEVTCYVVEAQVTFPGGQSVENLGAVFIYEDARGDALPNAVMKATTKAIRRTVLSACGLGMLDESEIDSISGAVTARIQQPPSPLRSALDDVRRPAPAPVAPAPRTEFGQWAEARCAEINGQWAEIARKAGVDPGKPITKHQVGNHLIKTWIASGMLTDDSIQTEGRRDKNKVALHLSAAWEEEPDDVKDEVDQYLQRELTERARAAGVALPGMSDDEPADVNGAELEPAIE